MVHGHVKGHTEREGTEETQNKYSKGESSKGEREGNTTQSNELPLKVAYSRNSNEEKNTVLCCLFA